MSSVVERGPASRGVERYVAAFDALKDRRPAGPSWLGTRRDVALQQFAAAGFPTVRDEEYRFTSVAPIASTEFGIASGDGVVAPADVTEHLYGAAAAAELVFVDGHLSHALSSLGAQPGGLSAGSLREGVHAFDAEVEPRLAVLATTDDSAFTALNTAFFEDGALVRVAKGAVIEAPINLVFVSTGASRPNASFPRVLILAGEHSECRVIETHVGAGGGRHFSCAVTEVALAPSARVDYYRVQVERPEGYHYCRLQVRAERAAQFVSHAFSLGGAIVRNDLAALLAGEGIDCTLNGLYLADDRTLVDNHTTIDHAQPHCGSHEVYKGILGGASRGVFNGKIIVREDAQKTDAKQTNKVLLLSNAAQINTKPQLEIFADDVKCTHGATVGQLDADSMFYLQTRGISRLAARALLIRGFAGDLVSRVAFDPLRTRLERLLLEQIPKDAV
jgi:Fe-S cluster assembly protein SufD